jgi:hypothetical protein
VRNHKLRDPLDPDCAEWVDFDATSSVQPIFGGLAHVDTMWAEAPPGEAPFEGFTLRQFDPAAKVWRIWWASSRQPGHLDPPVEGVWADGRGTFLVDDVLAGQPVRVRFTWTNETPTTARWEQAFSTDDGASWRTNWVMDFTRAEA